jgi:hypothetical protein
MMIMMIMMIIKITCYKNDYLANGYEVLHCLHITIPAAAAAAAAAAQQQHSWWAQTATHGPCRG